MIETALDESARRGLFRLVARTKKDFRSKIDWRFTNITRNPVHKAQFSEEQTMSEARLIDATQEKTEAEWLATLDRFWLAATPKLFDWYKWAACLAGLEIVKERNPHWALLGIYSFSYCALIFYFHAFFAQFQFKLSNHKSRSDNWHRTISICLAGSLALATFYIVAFVAHSVGPQH